MSNSNKLSCIFLLVCIGILGGLIGWGLGLYICRKIPHIETRIDTVVLRDTIRETVFVPRIVRSVRVDTVRVKVAADTVYIDAEIPIEHKTYQTDDYRAEIEGFRPSLVSMEVYRKTNFITKTETITLPDRRRWGLGLQVGYGGAFFDGRLKNSIYIGIGVSYNIITF